MSDEKYLNVKHIMQVRGKRIKELGAALETIYRITCGMPSGANFNLINSIAEQALERK